MRRLTKMQLFRLTKQERREVERKWMEINKTLINNGGSPITEPEFLHEILKLTVNRIRINERNQLVIGSKESAKSAQE